MILSAMIVWLWQRSLAARIAALTETIQIFGASVSSIRTNDRSSDELGKLAEAFNCMADDVVHAQGKLQKQLDEQRPSPQQ
jgi:nitrate/nitrite-specific signal transduction histidine kinase